MAAASQQLPPAGASQPIKPVSAVPDAAPGGELPLMLPEKLPGGRFLVELEADANGAADLAGDAGAVGRFTFAGDFLIHPCWEAHAYRNLICHHMTA